MTGGIQSSKTEFEISFFGSKDHQRPISVIFETPKSILFHNIHKIDE
jgi:hypothetical protein